MVLVGTQYDTLWVHNIFVGTQCGILGCSIWYSVRYLWVLSVVFMGTQYDTCGYSVWYLLVLRVVLLGTQFGTPWYTVWYLRVLSMVLVGTQYDTCGY